MDIQHLLQKWFVVALHPTKGWLVLIEGGGWLAQPDPSGRQAYENARRFGCDPGTSLLIRGDDPEWLAVTLDYLRWRKEELDKALARDQAWIKTIH